MTALDTILDRSPRAQHLHDNDYLVCCPVPSHGQGHGDTHPSLSVKHANGRTLLCCQAGCDTQDVMTAYGLDWPDLFDEPLHREEKVCAWIYTDPIGEPYLIVERWQKPDGSKRFSQRLPNADRPGLPANFKPCLYRLPKVLAAAKDHRDVWIVEGEKCVSAAEQMGLTATTSPGGAGKWKDYYTSWLVGVNRVNIVVDNDPAGAKHGAEVAVCCRGAGIPVKTWRVRPDHPKADLWDHQRLGYGVGDLIPIRLNRLRPTGFSATELMTTDYPPVTWAIPGLLPTGLALLGGPPKLAKSILALDMALGVAHGGRALGGLPCSIGSVLYLSVDNDSARRLQARVRLLMPDQALACAVPIEFHTEFPTGDAALKACQEWVDDEHDDGRHPLLVVVDTLGKVEPFFEGSGGENAYLASMATLSKWSRFATENDVAVLAVHHDRKSPDDDWLNRFTGSRGLTATAQTLMMIEARRGAPTGVLHVAGRDIDTDDIEIHRSKQHYGWTVAEEVVAEFDHRPFTVIQGGGGGD